MANRLKQEEVPNDTRRTNSHKRAPPKNNATKTSTQRNATKPVPNKKPTKIKQAAPKKQPAKQAPPKKTATKKKNSGKDVTASDLHIKILAALTVSLVGYKYGVTTMLTKFIRDRKKVDDRMTRLVINKLGHKTAHGIATDIKTAPSFIHWLRRNSGQAAKVCLSFWSHLSTFFNWAMPDAFADLDKMKADLDTIRDSELVFAKSVSEKAYILASHAEAMRTIAFEESILQAQHLSLDAQIWKIGVPVSAAGATIIAGFGVYYMKLGFLMTFCTFVWRHKKNSITAGALMWASYKWLSNRDPSRPMVLAVLTILYGVTKEYAASLHNAERIREQRERARRQQIQQNQETLLHLTGVPQPAARSLFSMFLRR